jgi:hypothetical protein
MILQLLTHAPCPMPVLITTIQTNCWTVARCVLCALFLLPSFGAESTPKSEPKSDKPEQKLYDIYFYGLKAQVDTDGGKAELSDKELRAQDPKNRGGHYDTINKNGLFFYSYDTGSRELEWCKTPDLAIKNRAKFPLSDGEVIVDQRIDKRQRSDGIWYVTIAYKTNKTRSVDVVAGHPSWHMQQLIYFPTCVVQSGGTWLLKGDVDQDFKTVDLIAQTMTVIPMQTDK